MNKKTVAYGEMNKKKYELEDKMSEFEQAQDHYREVLVNETVSDILNVLEENEKITERDLKLFLSNLALESKQIYYK